MTNLAQAIQRAQILNEQKLTAGIPLPQLEPDAALLLDPWNRYCAFNGVRNLGSPRLVATFIKAEAKLGTDPNKIALIVSAISDLHEAHGLSNPCATRTVREALGAVLNIQPPRSWRKHEQTVFMTLPVEIRAAIERREYQRETDLRRCQNDAALFRKAAEAKRSEEAELNRLMATEMSTAITSTKEGTESVTQTK